MYRTTFRNPTTGQPFPSYDVNRDCNAVSAASRSAAVASTRFAARSSASSGRLARFEIDLDRDVTEFSVYRTQLEWVRDAVVAFDVFELKSGDEDDESSETTVPFQVASRPAGSPLVDLGGKRFIDPRKEGVRRVP